MNAYQPRTHNTGQGVDDSPGRQTVRRHRRRRWHTAALGIAVAVATAGVAAVAQHADAFTPSGACGYFTSCHDQGRNNDGGPSTSAAPPPAPVPDITSPPPGAKNCVTGPGARFDPVPICGQNGTSANTYAGIGNESGVYDGLTKNQNAEVAEISSDIVVGALTIATGAIGTAAAITAAAGTAAELGGDSTAVAAESSIDTVATATGELAAQGTDAGTNATANGTNWSLPAAESGISTANQTFVKTLYSAAGSEASASTISATSGQALADAFSRAVGAALDSNFVDEVPTSLDAVAGPLEDAVQTQAAADINGCTSCLTRLNAFLKENSGLLMAGSLTMSTATMSYGLATQVENAEARAGQKSAPTTSTAPTG